MIKVKQNNYKLKFFFRLKFFLDPFQRSELKENMICKIDTEYWNETF